MHDIKNTLISRFAKKTGTANVEIMFFFFGKFPIVEYISGIRELYISGIYQDCAFNLT